MDQCNPYTMKPIYNNIKIKANNLIEYLKNDNISIFFVLLLFMILFEYVIIVVLI